MATFSPGIQAPGGQYITSLSYNQDAQLYAVNASSGALASYTYDAFGQRLIKTISGTSGEIYQYGQDGMLLEETNASGVAQADYIYLNGRPIATLNPSTGTVYYLQDDMLGTPQLATDSSQAVAWQATYQPFGTASVSGTVTQNLRFPGQYFDSESGWNHNGFRDYIPDLGRYAEPDPLAIQGSARFYNQTSGHYFSESVIALTGEVVTPYVYDSNDPIDYSDPLGLRPLTECEKERLSPFIPKIDLDSANLHPDKVPWWFRNKNYEGIAIHNDIYFRPGVYDPTTIEGLATLAHELVHVGQYRNGMTLAKYLWASKHGYDNNPYEKEAIRREEEIRQALLKTGCGGCKEP